MCSQIDKRVDEQLSGSSFILHATFGLWIVMKLVFSKFVRAEWSYLEIMKLYY